MQSSPTVKPENMETLIRLQSGDVAQAAGMHARAFLDDPYTVYTLRDTLRRQDQLLLLMALTLRYACRYGVVFATPHLEAVAAWMPPGNKRESNWRMIRVGALPMLWKLGPSVIRSYLKVEKLADDIHERYAPEPHWYLSQLGVEPGLQGQGYGKRVLIPTLEDIDRQGYAVYLETLNPKAIPFYQKLGFGICEEVHLPDGGPPMWSMRREPKK